MSVSRDRLSRNEDDIATYAARVLRNSGRLDFSIFDDERENQTPFQWRGIPLVPTQAPVRAFVATPRVHTRPYRPTGIENAVRGPVRRTGTPLPNWYPRKPLADITSVVKAIERRRDRLGETEGLRLESPRFQDRTPRRPSMYALDARPEHDVSMSTPYHSTSQTLGKVPKILLEMANKDEGDSIFITPQKKLLNNIDEVEKVVMAELQKVKRTPLARRQAREKRVKTLMSMR